jgi:RNA polymerase sigma-70 factor, ECF subfamily
MSACLWPVASFDSVLPEGMSFVRATLACSLLYFQARDASMSESFSRPPSFTAALLCPSSSGESSEADADVLLVKAVIEGKPRAAAQLWDRFSPMVRRVIRRSVAIDDVEDLVQEVFLRVFNRIGSLRDPAALRAFVLTVASSVIVSDIRRRKVRRFLWLTRQGDLPEHASAPADDENREALSRLYGVLDRSNHEERMSFVLKNLEGMELSEVGATLGISVATVKRRLAKVQERLSRAVGTDPQMAAALGLGDLKQAANASGGNR